MTYRVTNSMMQSLMLNDMYTNLNKLLDIQQQLSTQKKYQYASQNPQAVTKGMNLETMMTETDQYKNNLQDAVSWLKSTDSALGFMNDYFVRIRELAVNGGDSGLGTVDRMALGAELRQIKDAMMSLANSSMGSDYLFAGLKTGTMPFTIGPNGDVVYNGNNYALNWEFAREQTGKVSLTGREVFPLDETTNRLKGIEVPMDFQWQGRSEKLEFKVGNRTMSVRIPEKWTDEIANGLTDSADYNRFRDPGEPLEGWSLDEIAAMINGSKEMGDISTLLKATVVKDYNRGVQYLQIQSLTGEPVRLTSWPDPDPQNVSKGIKGAAYGDIGRAASSNGSVTVRFGDNKSYTVEVYKGETLQDVADKLNKLPDGRIWAAYKSDGVNEWLDITAKNPDDYFSVTTTGGATQFFATQQVTTLSAKSGPNDVVSSFGFDAAKPFSAVSDGLLTIRQGNNTYTVDISAGDDITAIAGNIPAGFTVTVTDKLEISSTAGEFSVTAEGGAVPLFSYGVHAASNQNPDANGMYSVTTAPLALDFALDPGKEGALSFELNGIKHWISLEKTPPVSTLDEVAVELGNALSTIDPNATVSVIRGLNDLGEEIQYMRIETSSGPFRLSGFKGAADATDMLTDFVTGSEDIVKNIDHTHIGFAAMMQMETALSSTEIPVGAVLGNTITDALHLNFASGSRTAEIFIKDDAALTLESLAARINSVCGDWLQAVVETDEPDGTNPIADPLKNSGENAEKATQRLVLRTLNGEPFAVYDGQGKSGVPAATLGYASQLGINTALTIKNDPLWNTATDTQLSSGAGYPSDEDVPGAGFFDENMPAILKVTVGDREFQVKVCKNNRYNGELVAKAIRDQVNEQYGGVLLGVGENPSQAVNGTDTFSVFAFSGEPLRVIDAAYGDPRFQEYTGGIATQLGINAGITAASGLLDTDKFPDGVIRISTPGHSVDVPVLDGEDLHTIANRIRDYAGSWLDVSFSDSNIANAGGTVRLAIAAKDGSAVSVLNIKDAGVSAKANKTIADIGLQTGLVGTKNLDSSVFDFKNIDPATVLTIDVNGASHTIDLWDSYAVPPGPTVTSVEELADMINTRFQGQDIRAEVLVTTTAGGVEKHLALWSPKGYNFKLSQPASMPAGNGDLASLGFDDPTMLNDNNVSNNHGNAGQPFNQVVTQRTGNNTYDIDFFGVMDNLINTVEGGNVEGLSDIILNQLDSWLSTLLKCRAQDGALTNRYDAAVYRMTSNNTNYTDLYTQTVGIDLAEAVTNYEMWSSVYQANLAAIARLLQPSLLDFLS